MPGVQRRIYEQLPTCIKQVVCDIPYSWLAGREYRRVLRQCRQLDLLSRPEVLVCQERELGDLLNFVVDRVPFYRRYRSVVARFKPRDALKEFPLMRKLDVQQHLSELIADCDIPHHEARTSGTSGNQLVFHEDETTYPREMGYMHSQWQRVGYSPRCRKATFRDVTLRVPKPGVFWQLNPIHNELQFSPFHMSEGHLDGYVEQFLNYRPEFVHGYPSAIAAFGTYLLKKRLCKDIQPVKAVLLGGEGCLPDQRARISEAFKARVYSWYGHSERVVLGGECEYSPCYHMFPSYGLLEIIADDGHHCEIGEEGEIVGTGFLNRSMPLIRYRTDDHAVLEAPQCECGRHWDRFSGVRGRRSIEGYVVGKTGAKISVAALETPSRAFRHVARFQYFQSRPGELRIRVLPTDQFLPGEAEEIVHAHEIRLLDEMEVVIDLVDEIPLTPAGKQPWIISELCL